MLHIKINFHNIQGVSKVTYHYITEIHYDNNCISTGNNAYIYCHKIYLYNYKNTGTTGYTARATMTAVCKVFGERVILRDLWPPRSPDLTPPDF